jgi:hypothetical protein
LEGARDRNMTARGDDGGGTGDEGSKDETKISAEK